jgi:hypothetical protein
VPTDATQRAKAHHLDAINSDATEQRNGELGGRPPPATVVDTYDFVEKHHDAESRRG